jgi:hypothetical protein
MTTENEQAGEWPERIWVAEAPMNEWSLTRQHYRDYDERMYVLAKTDLAALNESATTTGGAGGLPSQIGVFDGKGNAGPFPPAAHAAPADRNEKVIAALQERVRFLEQFAPLTSGDGGVASPHPQARWVPVSEILHASAPEGCKCSDCQMDQEPCPVCYQAWWQRRHPNTIQVAGAAYECSDIRPALQNYLRIFADYCLGDASRGQRDIADKAFWAEVESYITWRLKQDALASLTKPVTGK